MSEITGGDRAPPPSADLAASPSPPAADTAHAARGQDAAVRAEATDTAAVSGAGRSERHPYDPLAALDADTTPGETDSTQAGPAAHSPGDDRAGSQISERVDQPAGHASDHAEPETQAPPESTSPAARETDAEPRSSRDATAADGLPAPGTSGDGPQPAPSSADVAAGPPTEAQPRAGPPDAAPDTDEPQDRRTEQPAEVRHPADQAYPLQPLPPDERQGFDDYRSDLETSGRVREAKLPGEHYDYQRACCGPTEFRLSPDTDLPNATWADGLNNELGLAQDAKHVGADASSWYRPDTLPPALQRVAQRTVDEMIAKYAPVIADPANPVRGLEIFTNNPQAAAYFDSRMKALGVPGTVQIRE
jgi:hypothetical protein